MGATTNTGERDSVYLACYDNAHPYAQSYPVVFHEDAVPNYHDESACFWSWSVPLNGEASLLSRHCFVGLPTSRIQPATRAAIVDVLRWDMQALMTGIFPGSNHVGMPFPADSARGKRAGQWIMEGRRALFSLWKGDMEAHMKSHNLERHYLRNSICDLCMAQRRSLGLTFGDFSRCAYWRRTLEARAPCQDATPWRSICGFHKHRRTFDRPLACTCVASSGRILFWNFFFLRRLQGCREGCCLLR